MVEKEKNDKPKTKRKGGVLGFVKKPFTKRFWAGEKVPVGQDGESIASQAGRPGPQKTNPAEEAVQHHANDDVARILSGEGKEPRGAASGERPAEAGRTGAKEDVPGVVEDFGEWILWHNERIIEGTPKVPGGVQGRIWNVIGNEEFIGAIENVSVDPATKQPLTLTPEEKTNPDGKYEKGMKKVREGLVEKLREKNVTELTWDEVDVIITTMLHHPARIEETNELKYRNEFFQLIKDGAKHIKPGNESQVIGHVLNYLTKRITVDTDKTAEKKKAFHHLMDPQIAEQFFSKYSYPIREQLATDFYDKMGNISEEKKREYQSILLQEIHKNPSELDKFKQFYEGETFRGDSILAENLIKEHKIMLTRVLLVVHEIIQQVKEDESIIQLELNRIEKKKDVIIGNKEKKIEGRLNSIKSIDPETKKEIKNLLERTYEVAKKKNENYKYMIKKTNEYDKMTSKQREGARDKIEGLGKEAQVDIAGIEKLEKELIQKQFPVLKVAYDLIKEICDKNASDGKEIKKKEYLLALVHYSGGSRGKGDYSAYGHKREWRLLRWLKTKIKWMGSVPLLKHEPEWEELQEIKKLKQKMQPNEKKEKLSKRINAALGNALKKTLFWGADNLLWTKKVASIKSKFWKTAAIVGLSPIWLTQGVVTGTFLAVSKAIDSVDYLCRTDWLKKLFNKVDNEVRRNILTVIFFPFRVAHSAAVLIVGVPAAVVLWPLSKLLRWTTKEVDTPKQIIREDITSKLLEKDRERRYVTTHAWLTASKIITTAGILAAAAGMVNWASPHIKKGLKFAGSNTSIIWEGMWSGRYPHENYGDGSKHTETEPTTLEANLKSRDHYASAYYRESEPRPYSKMLARSYYGVKEGEETPEEISNEDIQALGNVIYNREVKGTPKQKAWLEEYAKDDEEGYIRIADQSRFQKYKYDKYEPDAMAVVSIENKDGTYSMGVNTPTAHEKKKQLLDKQLAWLESHPEVVKFLEEAYSLREVDEVTTYDRDINIDKKKSELKAEGWYGNSDGSPVLKEVQERNKQGKLVTDGEGNPKMVKKDVYYKTSYTGPKKDGIKLNTDKTEKFLNELMNAEKKGKTITAAYLSENLLDFIDNDYLIAAKVNQCMRAYKIKKLENAKFLVNNPTVMDWIKPMFVKGNSAWHVNPDKRDVMVELLVNQADKDGAIPTLSMAKLVPLTTMTVTAKILNDALKKELTEDGKVKDKNWLLEDTCSLFGMNKAGQKLREQLKEHYPRKSENAFYLLENEIVKQVNDMGHQVKEGKEKEVLWMTLWELGQQNATDTSGDCNNALFPPARSTPSGKESMNDKREEIMSKVVVWAKKKNLLDTISAYKPEMSVRELMLDYRNVGGYNIVDDRADDFVTRVKQHLEKGGSTLDFEQPYGRAFPWLVSQGIIEIPGDEVTAAESEKGGLDMTLRIVPETIKILPNLQAELKIYLSVNDTYDKMVGEYNGDKVDYEINKFITLHVNAYYSNKKAYEDTGDEKYKKSLRSAKSDLKKSGIIILSEKMKNEDDKKLVILSEEMKNKDNEKPKDKRIYSHLKVGGTVKDERIYSNLSVGDPIIKNSNDLIRTVLDSKVMEEKFPKKEGEKKEVKKETGKVEAKKEEKEEAEEKPEKKTKKKSGKKKKKPKGPPPPPTFG